MYLKDITRVPFAEQYPPKKVQATMSAPTPVADRPRPAVEPRPATTIVPRRFCIECGELIGPHFTSNLCRSCAHEPHYQPTQEEIRAACAEIQLEWDEDMRIRRRTGEFVEDEEPGPS